MNTNNAVVEINPTKNSSSLLKIDPSNIRIVDGFNVRQDMGDLEELASSLIENGQLEPLIVSKVKGEDTYELIEGHRRMAAINLLRERGEDFPYVTATTSQMTAEERIFAMLVTGSTKKNLTDLEQAEAIKRLQNKGYEVADIAKKMGCSVAKVNQKLELASAPKALKDMVQQGDIAASTAVNMLRSEGEEKVVELVAEAVAEIKAEKGGEVTTTKGEKKRIAETLIKNKVNEKKGGAAKAKTPNINSIATLFDAILDKVRDLNENSEAICLLDDILVELAEAQENKRIPNIDYIAESFVRNCKVVA
jgi:ParB/RepB/Spo0J family partition protein